MKKFALPLFAAVLLAGCSVWPVNQDPQGMEHRRDLNAVLLALQNYHRDHAAFPAALADLAPNYIAALPNAPYLTYHAADGSLEYHYTPSWPQLRPVWCASVGNSTEWRCEEHIL